MYKFLCEQFVFISFDYIPMSGTAGKYGNLLFIFFKHFQTNFQSGWSILNSYYQSIGPNFCFSCPKMLITQPCLTLCNPMACSPPGSSIHGILHARILELVAIPFPKGSSQLRDRTLSQWYLVMLICISPMINNVEHFSYNYWSLG